MGNHAIRLLKANEIECRVSAVKENGVSLLLYKDARVDQKILDETFPQKTIKGMKRSTALLLSMIHRAIEPGSKREFSSWANGTSLPYHMKFHAEDLSSQAFWEAMDGISQEQISAAWEKVMERLLDLCGIDIPCFHLDYSNYFTYIDSKITAASSAKGGTTNRRGTT